MSELDEYVNQQNRLLQEISELERYSQTTLKEKVRRLCEVTVPLIESDYYPDKNINDLSSIIINKLKPYKIPSVEHYSGWLYDVFEKFGCKKSAQKAGKISSLPIEKRTGIDIIDRLKQAQRNSGPLPDDYMYSKYLLRVNDTANETLKQSESLLRKLEHAFYFIDKFDKEFPDKTQLENELKNTAGNKQKELTELYNHYQSCNQLIQDIESGIGTVPDKLEELNEILATQKFNSKQIDERSKITFIEKWNIIVCQIDMGISAIAKKLGINKKHISNNIRPTNNPVTNQRNRHHDYINWFRAIKVVSPDGKEFTFDAKAYFDEQIERGKLQIPFKPMVLRNAVIE